MDKGKYICKPCFTQSWRVWPSLLQDQWLPYNGIYGKWIFQSMETASLLFTAQCIVLFIEYLAIVLAYLQFEAVSYRYLTTASLSLMIFVQLLNLCCVQKATWITKANNRLEQLDGHWLSYIPLAPTSNTKHQWLDESVTMECQL